MITFTISVNYRDTEVSASQDDRIIWNTLRFIGGGDWVFNVLTNLRTKENLLVGKMSAYYALKEIGSALPLQEERTRILRGRDLTNYGEPGSREISSIQMREWIDALWLMRSLKEVFESPDNRPGEAWSFQPIPDALKPSLSNTPIMLTGEFGALKGLAQLIQDGLGLPVNLSDDAGLAPEDKLTSYRADQ